MNTDFLCFSRINLSMLYKHTSSFIYATASSQIKSILEYSSLMAADKKKYYFFNQVFVCLTSSPLFF